MNRGELKTQTKFNVGDPNGTRFTDSQYNTALDQANRHFTIAARAWKEQTFTHSAGTTTQSLPDDFVGVDFITQDGELLDPISEHKLNKIKRADRWDDDEGAPSYYIIDPKDKTLRPYPKYTSGDDKTLVLRYFFFPDPMTSDNTEPMGDNSLTEPFHEGIAAYAAWLLLGGVEPTAGSEARSQRMNEIYQDRLQDALNFYKDTSNEVWGGGGGRQGRRPTA